MSIEVSLFGFGNTRPAGFGKQDRIELSLDTPVSPADLLHKAGFEQTRDLVIIVDDELVLASQWHLECIGDGASVRVMSAFEGG